MRRAALVLILPMLAVAACSAPGEEDANAAKRASQPPLLAVAAGGTSGCTMTWNGAAAEGRALADRVVGYTLGAVERMGGPANFTEPPPVVLQAPAELPYNCVAQAVGHLQRGGAAAALNLSAGGNPRPSPAHMIIDNSPVGGQAIVDIADDGALKWNDEPVEEAQLAQRIRGQQLSDLPGEAVVIPGAGASFGAVYRVVRAFDEAGVVPTLIGCGAAAQHREILSPVAIEGIARQRETLAPPTPYRC